MIPDSNTVAWTMAAQSLSTNEFMERHNGIAGGMIRKTIRNTNFDFDVALAWSLSAKSTIDNINGY